MKKTPLALLSYDRPAHVRLALEALSRCDRIEECCLHIFCDGPAAPSVEAGVQATRQEVKAWAGRLGAVVVERDRNLGVAGSVVTAVTDLCARYGRVIVLEDDFVVSPDFVDFMLQALDRYADEANVYQIDGYMFPIRHRRQPDAFFLPLSSTRGWATWQRAWRIFDWNATGAREKLKDPRIQSRFNLDDSHPFCDMLSDRLAGRNQSWGILWWWAVFQAGGVVLYPRESLVWVGGFDGTGTHCTPSPDYIQPSRESFSRRQLSTPIQWPERVTVDAAALRRVQRLLRSSQPRSHPLWLRRLLWSWQSIRKGAVAE